MAGVSSPGVGSGIDISGIVNKLMAIEQQPISKINTQLVELKAQVSAYGALKSSVSTFRDTLDKLADLSKFKVYAATSSDTTVLSGSASSAAGKGVYNLEVKRLAENHRMAANTTYADTGTTTIGTTGDTLTLTAGSSGFTVDTGGKTLAGIRDAINQAADNTGVTASLFKDDTGYRLSLAANKTGADGALAVAYSGSDVFALQTLNTDRDASGSFTPADLNAVVKLENNFTITSTSNTISDAVEGVTMTLMKAGTVTLSVDRDTASVTSTVQDFAKSYSDLIALMTKMRGDVLKTDQSAVSGIESQMRALLNKSADVTGGFSNVFQVGLSTQKNGSLAVSATALASAMNSDYAGFANLFADPTNGVAGRLRSLASSFLDTGAVIDGRRQGLESQIKSSEDRKARMAQRLTIIQDRLTSQYNKLDSVVSSLQGSGGALLAQLNAMNASLQR